jgi:hypothetical protein
MGSLENEARCSEKISVVLFYKMTLSLNFIFEASLYSHLRILNSTLQVLLKRSRAVVHSLSNL